MANGEQGVEIAVEVPHRPLAHRDHEVDISELAIRVDEVLPATVSGVIAGAHLRERAAVQLGHARV